MKSKNATSRIENQVECNRITLAFIPRFIHKTKNKNSGCLTVEILKQSEIPLYIWSQVGLDTERLNKKMMAKENEDGIVGAHRRLKDLRTLPANMCNPVISHPTAETSTRNHRPLWVQEVNTRS